MEIDVGFLLLGELAEHPNEGVEHTDVLVGRDVFNFDN